MSKLAETSNRRQDISTERFSVEIADEQEPKTDKWVTFAVWLSALVNICLLAAKLFAYLVSGSQSILASLADSGVDLASQIVVFFCDLRAKKVDKKYPVGKTRLETVGALMTACIMTFASATVIESAVRELVKGIGSEDPPVPNLTVSVSVIIAMVILSKAAVFILCYWLRNESDSTLVLAQDHKNDVLSNTVVLIAAGISTIDKKLWYLDPVGGLVLSVFIIICWVILADKQIKKIVGLTAPEDFYEKIRELASAHDNRVEVDTIRAYHQGLRFFVEVDVVMPGDLHLYHTHDSALELQRKIENLDEVERAFVHVDYARRESPEHKVDWSMQ